jgi:hypothetical protein
MTNAIERVVEPIPLASVAYIERAIRLRAHVTVVMLAGVAAVATISAMLHAFTATLWPVLVGLACVAVIWLDESRQLRRLLRSDTASATVAGKYLTVIAGKRQTCLRVSPGLLARARRNALPRATL